MVAPQSREKADSTAALWGDDVENDRSRTERDARN